LILETEIIGRLQKNVLGGLDDVNL